MVQQELLLGRIFLAAGQGWIKEKNELDQDQQRRSLSNTLGTLCDIADMVNMACRSNGQPIRLPEAANQARTFDRAGDYSPRSMVVLR